MLAPREDLAAAEIACFSPAFVVGIFLLTRHGFNRSDGWLYIVILCILRIIGASATLYEYSNNDYSAGVLETAAITSAIGTAPLLLALTGFLHRITSNRVTANHPHNHTTLFQGLKLLSIAALVLGIIGGDYEFGSHYETGRTLIKVVAILFLLILLALTAIALFHLLNMAKVAIGERRLFWASVLALPFLYVRIAYTLGAAFAPVGSVFYFRDVNVYVQAFMQFLMEIIIVTIYIVGGLFTEKAEARYVQEPRYVQEGGAHQQSETTTEMGGYKSDAEPRLPRRSRQGQGRTLFDYRPSKLIRDAMRKT